MMLPCVFRSTVKQRSLQRYMDYMWCVLMEVVACMNSRKPAQSVQRLLSAHQVRAYSQYLLFIVLIVLISVLFCLYTFTWELCARFDFIVDSSVLLRRVNHNL